MPELPEVETMRRGIAPVVGARIAAVERPRCRLRPILLSPSRLPQWRQQLVGATITGTSRAGKRVIVELGSGDRLVFEPRMTGLVLLADPPDKEHLRLRIMLAGQGARQLLFWDRRGLGSARLLTAAQFAAAYGLDKLGPDALEITDEQLRDRLKRSRRAIKVALLDQRALAGVGNLYASEILHLCGIHPARRCDRLSRGDWQAVVAAMRDVLTTAIRYEGSTLADGTYRNALNQAGGYQNHHRVYDRADAACTRCRAGRVVRIVQAQRSTFYCPQCQKK
ncbi:MAG: bifunctional DNA-formamidopyrimidine glycosylase/DNA-(apurinic or apyrimidinic site) lyase [Pirellulales bacterium]